MARSEIDADDILNRATPLAHQQAHGIQPFGHLVRMPIALSEKVCKESVLATEGGDDGNNDLIVSDVIRRNEPQVWFVAEHVVEVPPTHAV
jgi:hypothetical protein